MQQDYIVRQIQQLAAVLAQVLFRKRAGEVEDAQTVLEAGIAEALGCDLEVVHGLGRDALEAMCAPGEPLAGETALAVAEVLAEDREPSGRRRALWLYEIALEAGEAVPFDVHDRIEALRQSLS